jgi:peptidyl-prolyl cis-trans isomerase B (cyclophilin B)
LKVATFVKLARASYFDGVPIHRVVPNFVLQDGDPTGTGNGGPGYEIRDELTPLIYERGTVGMALSGPDTGGSQWFVTHSPQPHLNGLYTVFGRVVAGQEIVEGIEQGDLIRKITISEAP